MSNLFNHSQDPEKKHGFYCKYLKHGLFGMFHHSGTFHPGHAESKEKSTKHEDNNQKWIFNVYQTYNLIQDLHKEQDPIKKELIRKEVLKRIAADVKRESESQPVAHGYVAPIRLF